MKRVEYCLVAGQIRSKWDDEYHFVGAPALARLYKLPEGSWREHSTRIPVDCGDLVHLRPRLNGDYTLPES